MANMCWRCCTNCIPLGSGVLPHPCRMKLMMIICHSAKIISVKHVENQTIMLLCADDSRGITLREGRLEGVGATAARNPVQCVFARTSVIPNIGYLSIEPHYGFLA